MRRANTTYVNLRATLDDVDPLVRDFKPVAKKLRPYTARAAPADRRRAADRARPGRGDPQAGRRQRPGRAGATDAAAARHRGRARAAQRRGARGRAAGHGRGAVQRDPADRVRPPLLGRLHRLARRLLPQRQLRRDGRLRAHRDARERLLVQERAGRADRARPARRVVQEPGDAGPEQPLSRVGRARHRRRLDAAEALAGLQLRSDPGAARDDEADRSRSAVLVVAVVALALVLAGGGGEDEGRRYTVELDNAFGLVEGGDVRVAGANAGRILALKLDTRTQKALVEVEITEQGFGSLRADVFCEARPQSPIGEYFMDCLPGTSKRELPPGSRVPVKQTASTIPPDLIQNIMRLPYRERFRLILNEFGAGVAGRPEDLNEAVRRAVPALRQTARLLEVLAKHDTVIRDLVTDADTVLERLADNRRNVGRFVVEARDTASASAERARRHPDELPQAAVLPRGADADDGGARRGGRRAASGARGPERERGRAEALLRRHGRVGDRQPARDPLARRCRGAGPPGRARRPSAGPRAAPLRAPHARPGPQPAHPARGLRRPRPRGRARPAQPRRPGLLGHPGAAALRLQPVADHQRVRRAGLHGAHRRAHRQVLPVRGCGDAPRIPTCASAAPGSGPTSPA